MGENEELLTVGTVVRDRWKATRKLGEGGFGAVFEVYDMQTRENAALKIESVKERVQVLKMEVAVFRRLQGKTHVCKFLGCGRNEKFNYVVMQLVGKNLGDLKREVRDQKFTYGTTMRVGYQCGRAIEDIHSIGFLHRDIKPGNYAIGATGQTARTVFMLDFGMARQYINNRGVIRTPRAAAGFRGTVRYASINCHRNREMGRQDDLWCLFYMMVEFMVGALPWRNVADKDEVGRMKENVSPQQLLKGCPEEMFPMMKHLQQLQYADKPDYQYLYSLMDKVLRKVRVHMDDPYDWEKAGNVIQASAPKQRSARLERGPYADKPDYANLYTLMDKVLRKVRVAMNDPYDWETGARRPSAAQLPKSDPKLVKGPEDRTDDNMEDPFKGF